ncbi:hypothetical protein [Capnocytophaga canimorsus]|uniref:hypothetical protein n=1 Tax=Capnocytophaga canimorsus TaxID=28188 RepID=UPI001562766F|nr:hypothetical protein [Capnocytophaga canimorsus]
MTLKEFIEILEKPNQIQAQQMHELEEILLEYPYFQAARVLQLKKFHTEQNYRYNKALKLAAVHVANRSVLYDFIHSKSGQHLIEAEVIRQIALQKTTPKTDFVTPTATYQKMPQTEMDSFPKEEIVPKIYGSFTDNQEADAIAAKNQVSQTDLHSFSQWLKTISEVGNPSKQEERHVEENPKIAEKFKLIDRFLETNPKIEPSREYVSNINLANEVKTDPHQLMTETLAQVYVKQRKYKQAIQAYEILILKNPEKSGYFADQIRTIKNLQQNNL